MIFKKKLIFSIAFFTLILFLNQSFAFEKNIEKQIEDLIGLEIPNSNVGIIIQDANTKKTLYAKNEQKLFNPASTLKLFTATAALIELGPKFQFKTSLYSADINKNNNSTKNIYIKFTGDPELTYKKLNSLLRNIKTNGINNISQNIFIDDSLFSGPKFGPGWAWESNQWQYSSPITAAMLNQNKIGVKLIGGKNINESITAKFLNNNYTYNIKSNLKHVSYLESEKKCRIVINADKNNNYDISGCWPLKKYGKRLMLSVSNPRLHLQQAIKKIISDNKIKFSGKIIFKKFNEKNLVNLSEVRSRTLDKMLYEVLSKSDNIYTESITKTLGSRLFKEGSFKTGTLAIKNILSDEFGFDFESYRLVDGSGSSRYNYISPLLLNKLLLKIYENKNIYSVISKNLAKPGSVGTLQDRVKSIPQNSLKAKTGTMAGVSSLSGFMKFNSGNDIVFTIIINGFHNNNDFTKKVKNFEDSFCNAIAKIT